MSDQSQFSQKLLNIGFISAIILAFICLSMGGFYLYMFLTSTNSGIQQVIADVTHNKTSEFVLELAINARIMMARLALLSCGVFIGMAFGFLGFALFLIGIKNEMELEAKSEVYTLKIARLAPGVFVILCSAILIGICMTHMPTMEYSKEGFKEGAKSQMFQDSIDVKFDTDLLKDTVH